jgi:RNA polymerase sigma factor (sigma-70 family)
VAKEIDTFAYFAKKLKKFDVLGKEEELRLLTLAQTGSEIEKEEAINDLVNHNLKFVIKIAKKYSPHMELMDLVQVGSIGLMKAVQLFNLESGNKFSTYAFYWILQSINKEVYDKGSLIRIPAYISEAIPRVRKAEDQLLQAGIVPTTELISEITGDAKNKVYLVLKHTRERVIKSLDFEDDEGMGIDLKTSIKQEIYADPEDNYEMNEFEKGRAEAIVEALKTFSIQHQEIIIYRYGLDGHKRKRTLQEVSVMVGVTKERVRQIEKSVLTHLRDPRGFSNRRKKIKDFY